MPIVNIPPSFHAGQPDTPAENTSLQRLIERVDDSAAVIAKALYAKRVREIEIIREEEFRSFSDGKPVVVASATITLDRLCLRDGSKSELMDMIRDELCSMFGLWRK